MILKWRYDSRTEGYKAKSGPFVFSISEDWHNGWCWSLHSKEHETGWQMGIGSRDEKAAKKKVYTWCKKHLK